LERSSVRIEAEEVQIFADNYDTRR